MSFLLDTNVVSEWVKPEPDLGVAAWLDRVDEDRTYLSVVTIAELHFGVARLADGQRKSHLAQWLGGQLLARFGQRLLEIDTGTAQRWGSLMAQSQRAGRSSGAMDGLIAATASYHGMTLVTRNVDDFAAFGIPLLNPWRT